MGLLDKINRKATPGSVLRRALASGAIGAAFFVLFKPAVREAWPVLLPLWVLLCAAVGALAEWQVPEDGGRHKDGHRGRDEKGEMLGSEKVECPPFPPPFPIG
jgi:hypothetical protein